MSYEAEAKASTIRKCEAVAITMLVDGHRKYAPVVHCESRAGTSYHDSWEDLLRGSTAEKVEQAATRDSVYLLVLVIEFSAKEPAQYVLPMFLAKAEVQRMEGAKCSREHHGQLLAKTLQSLGPV